MDKIEVGEWVRLSNGKIGKVIATEKGSIMLDIVSNRWTGMCCIVKHSKNKTDLIEVGDYVNGDLVYKTTDNLIYVRGKSVIHKHTSIIKDIVRTI